MTKYGVFFVTPDKKRSGADDFTQDDCIWNQDVAHLRIHVERAINQADPRVPDP